MHGFPHSLLTGQVCLLKPMQKTFLQGCTTSNYYYSLLRLQANALKELLILKNKSVLGRAATIKSSAY